MFTCGEKSVNVVPLCYIFNTPLRQPVIPFLHHPSYKEVSILLSNRFFIIYNISWLKNISSCSR